MADRQTRSSREASQARRGPSSPDRNGRFRAQRWRSQTEWQIRKSIFKFPAWPGVHSTKIRFPRRPKLRRRSTRPTRDFFLDDPTSCRVAHSLSRREIALSTFVSSASTTSRSDRSSGLWPAFAVISAQPVNVQLGVGRRRPTSWISANFRSRVGNQRDETVSRLFSRLYLYLKSFLCHTSRSGTLDFLIRTHTHTQGVLIKIEYASNSESMHYEERRIRKKIIGSQGNVW